MTKNNDISFAIPTQGRCDPRAYSQKNQYLFGSQLMVCPITSPADKVSGLGSVTAWISKGVYTDIFTEKTYEGPRMTVLNEILTD